MEYDPVIIDFITVMMAMAIALFMFFCFLYGYTNPDKVEPLKFSDKFELGYIEDKNPQTQTSLQEVEYDELEDLQRQVKIRKLKQQLKEMDSPKPQRTKNRSEPKKETNPIILDCIDAMIAMGEKKSVARATVHKYFINNPNTKNVEDFLSGVFKR